VRPDSRIHWSSYPALLLAAAFACGVTFESVAEWGIIRWMGIAAAGGMLGAASALYGRRRIVSLSPLGQVCALALLALAAGGSRQAAYVSPAPTSVSFLPPLIEGTGIETVMTGVVDGVPTEANGTWRFAVRLQHLSTGRDSLAVTGRVQATLHNPVWISTIQYPSLREGDRVRLRGTLERAPGPRNPGAFDYAAYLERRGICCTVYVQGDEHVEVLGSHRSRLRTLVTDGRRYVRQQVDRYVPSPTSQAVLRALLLGDRSDVTRAQREQFASTGLMHLLAVSGLHVLLVGMILYRLLRPMLMRVRLPLWAREGMRAGLTLTVLAFYMLLTGARPSVVRAVVMAAVLIGGLLVQRSSHTLNSLGIAALLLLGMRPPALFDTGFQLSMCAVAGIVTLHPRMIELAPEELRDHPAANWTVSLLSVSLAATLATAPVLLFHFGQAQLPGVVLNLPAIPLTAAGLTAGIVCVLAGGISPVVAAPFGAAADAFLQSLVLTARWGADWFTWGILRGPKPGGALLMAAGAALLMGAQWPRPRTRWGLVALTATCLCVWVWAPLLRGTGGPHLDVVFLDVGQGDAVHLTTPNGRHLLVDTGPRTRYSDAGRRVLVPYLRSRGVRSLDAVVITHPDSDHLGGLPTLLRAVPVDRIVHSGWEADTRLYTESRRLLDSLSIPHRPVEAGDTITLDPSTGIQVLAPPPGNRRSPSFTENDVSVVLRVTYGHTEILLTGDIEEAGEDWLVSRYAEDLSSEVVKIPHHGSSTSSSPRLVSATTMESEPQTAIVSVGRRNAFGLPDPHVLSRWRSAGSTVLSTAESGAVWMQTDGDRVWRKCWNGC